MIKRILVTTLLACTLVFTGCAAETKTEPETTKTTEAEEKKSDKEDDKENKEKETEKKEKESEKETEKETKKESEKETEKKTDKETGKQNLIKASNKGDGYITNDPEELSEALEGMGLTEKELTEDTFMSDYEAGIHKQNIYKFTMMNVDDLREVPSGDENIFATTLLMDDTQFLIMFGSSETSTYEELLPYCSSGKKVEYWAQGIVSEGVMAFVPLVAGTEDSGYYLVKSCAREMGADVSKMTTPDVIGDDFDINSLNIDGKNDKPTDNTTDKTQTGSSEKIEGSVVLNIVGVDNDDFITVAACTVQNKFDFDIVMTGEQFFINGEDYSDSFTSYFELKKGETIEDEIYLDDCQLKLGDELEIVYTLMDANTYATLGELRFVMELEIIE